MGDLAHARTVRHDGGDVGCARASEADREPDGELEGGGDAPALEVGKLLPDGSYLKGVRVFSSSLDLLHVFLSWPTRVHASCAGR